MGGQPTAASADGHHLGWRLGAGWQLLERAGLAAPPPPASLYLLIKNLPAMQELQL